SRGHASATLGPIENKSSDFSTFYSPPFHHFRGARTEGRCQGGPSATCAIHFALGCLDVINCGVVMADIVLTTLNAKYLHAAFGLRYLLANLGVLKSRTCLIEFDIHQRSLDVVEVLLARQPRIVGCVVYIWIVSQTKAVIAILSS